MPFVGEQDEIRDEIEEFLKGVIHANKYDRVLAMVLSAGAGGDYEKVLDVFIRRQLEIFNGRLISYDGNGVLATFDGPARAIRCASAIEECAARPRAESRVAHRSM